MDSQAPVALNDQVIESLKPALVFKNFVRFNIAKITKAKRSELYRHFTRWQVFGSWM